MEAQRQSLFLNLGEALRLVGIAIPKQLLEGAGLSSETTTEQLVFVDQAQVAVDRLTSGVTADAEPSVSQEPLRVLIASLARGLSLDLPSQASVLDQLLAAKQQLRTLQVSDASLKELLQQDLPSHEKVWADAYRKVLMVLCMEGPS